MKPTLQKDLSSNRTLTVDEARCISFMGREGMVYATPRMVSDVEYTCRDFLLQHLDAGEDSVGTHVSIDHLAATPLGLQVTRSEEHTSELQSLAYLVCRLLLEKKKHVPSAHRPLRQARACPCAQTVPLDAARH